MNKKINALLFLLGVLWYSQPLMAQQKNDSDLVQFSGFVVNYDSTKTIPFATIRILGSSRGAYSDMQGYFSFVARKTDVLVFSCIGYEPRFFKLPANSKGTKFRSVVALTEDTFRMEEVVIIGRPTPEQMDYMFSRVRLPSDELAIAQQNLRRSTLHDQTLSLEFDAIDNARWRFQDYANKAYYAGQAQPIPILDVMAWSKFMDALQNGSKKKK